VHPAGGFLIHGNAVSYELKKGAAKAAPMGEYNIFIYRG